MGKLIFVKALLLGLFTIGLHASFYVKQTLPQNDLYVGQLFEIEIETISLESSQKHFFDFVNMDGVKVINPLKPLISYDEIRTYYKFYFVAQKDTIKTPDIIVTIIDSNYSAMQQKILEGKIFYATTLNPPQNFSNVIAKSLVVEGFKTSIYDSEHNIIAIKLFGEYTDLEDFSIPYTIRSGIKEHTFDHPNQEISYYAILKKDIDSLHFSYFDIEMKRYKHIEFPINIERDIVSTQTDLHPQKSKVYQLKLYGSLGVFLFFMLLFILKRGYFSLFLALLALAHFLYTIKPLATITINSGTIVYILPTENSTAIVKTEGVTQAKRLDSYGEYYKVEFEDGMIGWIKKDDSG